MANNKIRHPTDGYGAEYPFNRVTVHWPSGIEEHYDSTVGKERIRTAHMPSGTYQETKPDGRTVHSHTADHVSYHKGGVVQTIGGAKPGGGGGGGAGQSGGGQQAQSQPNPGTAGGNWDLKIGDKQSGGSARHEYGGGHYSDHGGGKDQNIAGHFKQIVGGSKTGTLGRAVGGDSVVAHSGHVIIGAGGNQTNHTAGAFSAIVNGGSNIQTGGDAALSYMAGLASSVKQNSESKVGGDNKKDVKGNHSHKTGGNHSEQAGGSHTTKGKDVNHNASGGMAMQAGQAISMLSKLFSMGSGSGGGGGGGGGGSGGGQMSANDSGISMGQGNTSIAANNSQITATGNVVANGIATFNGNAIFNGNLTINGNLAINGTAIFEGPTAYQGYDLQSSLVNNFFYIVSANVSLVVFNNSGVFGKGTITMPPSPIDGQRVEFTTANTITTLTINANAGQTVFGAPTTIAANTPFRFEWINSITSWFRV